jgi:hypothetical protein
MIVNATVIIIESESTHPEGMITIKRLNTGRGGRVELEAA